MGVKPEYFLEGFFFFVSLSPLLGKGKQQEVEESGKKGKKGETASDQVIQREDTRTGSEPVTDRQQPFRF